MDLFCVSTTQFHGRAQWTKPELYLNFTEVCLVFARQTELFELINSKYRNNKTAHQRAKGTSVRWVCRLPKHRRVYPY